MVFEDFLRPVPTTIRPEVSESTLPRQQPGRLGKKRGPSQHSPTGRSRQKPVPQGTAHFRDEETKAQSRRAPDPSHTGGEQQNATWNPAFWLPAPEPDTLGLLEDSETRKANKAPGEVWLRAAQPEGQGEAGAAGVWGSSAELGRARWTLPFPPQLHPHPGRGVGGGQPN